LEGDINDVASFKDDLAGFDVIIHSAGRAHVMNDQASDPAREFRIVNTEGTISLANAAAQTGVKRIVFLSSIKVNGERTEQGRPFNERSPANPVDPYGVSKHEAEMALRELSSNSQLEVCIIRPTLVYGEGVKGNVHRLTQLMKKGVPLPFASISKNKRSMIHIDNLLSLIVACARHPDAAGQTFLASDNNDMSTAEFVGYLAQLNGERAIQIPFPVWLLEIAANLLGRGREIDRLTGNLQVDIQHTMEVLEWTPPRKVGRS